MTPFARINFWQVIIEIRFQTLGLRRRWKYVSLDHSLKEVVRIRYVRHWTQLSEEPRGHPKSDLSKRMIKCTLSKAQMSMPPQSEICLEWRQKIPFFSSLFCAKALLAVSAAGRIGGTTKVKMSKLLSTISWMVPYTKMKLKSMCLLNWKSPLAYSFRCPHVDWIDHANNPNRQKHINGFEKIPVKLEVQWRRKQNRTHQFALGCHETFDTYNSIFSIPKHPQGNYLSGWQPPCNIGPCWLSPAEFPCHKTR